MAVEPIINLLYFSLHCCYNYLSLRKWILRLYVLVLMEYHGVYRNNNGNKNTKVNISIITLLIHTGYWSLINNSGTGERKEGMDQRKH